MFLLSGNKGWHEAGAPAFKNAMQAVLNPSVLLSNSLWFFGVITVNKWDYDEDNYFHQLSLPPSLLLLSSVFSPEQYKE